MKLLSHIGADGILQIQTTTDFKDKSVEVLVIIQPLDNAEIPPIEEIVPKYNAWGKPATKKSIQEAIIKMQQLRQEVRLEKNSIREMIEEGRRF
ncbi:hypothetical protein MEN41_13760 [Dolichospermum sp. ST_con]|nr:hypothetical protein [Dolichospermum sp. ST_con]MDD1421547.1 hypothetical protein [Dolichospermum sp. ST_sed1]MDD1430913.1 hypothetical protein [Dolichospermum sp. ST_sed6]MDD1438206.1 hypothetical protein [Dolichospermum sp. ST_sed10]MDD1443993.1 hypothetical protein [Dolichospermum sp. ST_sed3]MDD1446201.1 hypothetical protein [Dolichospermum sp. ST_sed8]MDD1461006.1 hypothetical protein [Dolichospermum sp. ST_sed2]MDD1469237.1 hypothetical protein [Dolichospermum sp. ST_sed5]MDD147082